MACFQGLCCSSGDIKRAYRRVMRRGPPTQAPKQSDAGLELENTDKNAIPHPRSSVPIKGILKNTTFEPSENPTNEQAGHHHNVSDSTMVEQTSQNSQGPITPKSAQQLTQNLAGETATNSPSSPTDGENTPTKSKSKRLLENIQKTPRRLFKSSPPSSASPVMTHDNQNTGEDTTPVIEGESPTPSVKRPVGSPQDTVQGTPEDDVLAEMMRPRRIRPKTPPENVFAGRPHWLGLAPELRGEPTERPETPPETSHVEDAIANPEQPEPKEFFGGNPDLPPVEDVLKAATDLNHPLNRRLPMVFGTIQESPSAEAWAEGSTTGERRDALFNQTNMEQVVPQSPQARKVPLLEVTPPKLSPQQLPVPGGGSKTRLSSLQSSLIPLPTTTRSPDTENVSVSPLIAISSSEIPTIGCGRSELPIQSASTDATAHMDYFDASNGSAVALV